jgi:hypothetical protein
VKGGFKNMKNKGQLGAGGMVMLAFGLIIGIAFLVAIAEQQSILTDKSVISNQSISTTLAYEEAEEVNETIKFTIYSQSDWKKIDCPLTSVVMRNGVGDTLTLTTDYVLNASEGTFTLVNTTSTVPSKTLNLTYADYTFCQDGYNTDASSRGIGRLPTLFFALALLAFAALGIREWIK